MKRKISQPSKLTSAPVHLNQRAAHGAKPANRPSCSTSCEGVSPSAPRAPGNSSIVDATVLATTQAKMDPTQTPSLLGTSPQQVCLASCLGSGQLRNKLLRLLRPPTLDFDAQHDQHVLTNVGGGRRGVRPSPPRLCTTARMQHLPSACAKLALLASSRSLASSTGSGKLAEERPHLVKSSSTHLDPNGNKLGPSSRSKEFRHIVSFLSLAAVSAIPFNSVSMQRTHHCRVAAN